MMRKEKGFTLVELLIVLAIIAALSTVLVPNIPRWTNSAKAGVIESDISQIANAMIQYVNSEGGNLHADANKATVLDSSSLKDFFTKQPSNPFGGYVCVKTSNYEDITTASATDDKNYGLIMYNNVPNYVAQKIQNDLGASVVKLTTVDVDSVSSGIADLTGTTDSDHKSITYVIQLNK